MGFPCVYTTLHLGGEHHDLDSSPVTNHPNHHRYTYTGEGSKPQTLAFASEALLTYSEAFTASSLPILSMAIQRSTGRKDGQNFPPAL